jgi:hypothetical protein
MSNPTDIFDVLSPGDQLKAKTAADLPGKLASMALETVGYMVARYNGMMGQIWANGTLTPHEAVAALGTSAVSLFTKAGALKALIVSQAPAMASQLAPVPEGWAFAPNADGTVSLTYTPPPEPDPEPEAPVEEAPAE